MCVTKTQDMQSPAALGARLVPPPRPVRRPRWPNHRPACLHVPTIDNHYIGLRYSRSLLSMFHTFAMIADEYEPDSSASKCRLASISNDFGTVSISGNWVSLIYSVELTGSFILNKRQISMELYTMVGWLGDWVVGWLGGWVIGRGRRASEWLMRLTMKPPCLLMDWFYCL